MQSGEWPETTQEPDQGGSDLSYLDISKYSIFLMPIVQQGKNIKDFLSKGRTGSDLDVTGNNNNKKVFLF